MRKFRIVDLPELQKVCDEDKIAALILIEYWRQYRTGSRDRLLEELTAKMIHLLKCSEK